MGKSKIVLFVFLYLLSGITGAEYLCRNIITDKENITYGIYGLISASGPATWITVGIVTISNEFGSIERFQEKS